ncbi:MAG: Holliday junction branch migration protein RuvA [Candidatus Falkowbacteria bacterium]|nr:Holliday junction branch migration protein RuvA [Candidatus Falkowbacteria bacterium]
MIAYLRGKIINKRNSYLVINVRDIGYKVFVSSKKFDEVSVGEDLELHIHQQVGEQILALYGVNNTDELVFFELLISVSGIGPKTALGVFNIGSIREIQSSILEGDTSLICEAPGIGKKTAERLILELRNKLSTLKFSEGEIDDYQVLAGEELDALMALGYNMIEAREALKSIDKEIKESSERIKQALKYFGK